MYRARRPFHGSRRPKTVMISIDMRLVRGRLIAIVIAVLTMFMASYAVVSNPERLNGPNKYSPMQRVSKAFKAPLPSLSAQTFSPQPPAPPPSLPPVFTFLYLSRRNASSYDDALTIYRDRCDAVPYHRESCSLRWVYIRAQQPKYGLRDRACVE